LLTSVLPDSTEFEVIAIHINEQLEDVDVGNSNIITKEKFPSKSQCILIESEIIELNIQAPSSSNTIFL
jgi:hypothetical protein